MIMVNKGNGTYVEVIAIYAKDQDQYREISKGYTQDGELIFSPTYMINEGYGYMPFQILADGDNVEDYTIWGNTVQDGTPTPENPVEPEFVGDLVSIELDEPLRAVDSENCDTIDLATKTYTKRITDEIILTGDEDWHMTWDTFYFTRRIYRKNDTTCVGTLDSVITYNGTYLGYGYWAVQLKFHGGDRSYTADDLKAYLKGKYLSGNPIKVWYCVADGAVETQTLSSIPDGLTGVIEGTVTQSGTPTPDNPIEPIFNGKLLPNGKYQVYKTYKIPISSGGQTKNIYLGQVPTTRRIKKLVLTGQETAWAKRRNTEHVFELTNYSRRGICSHYREISYPEIDTVTGVYTDCTVVIMFTDLRFTELSDFKSYLASQYAAGTPVTLWYVWGETETGIVNEPLVRIIRTNIVYADSIDFSQSGIEIPTLKKPNTTVIDVETEIKPSVINLTYWGEWQDKTTYLSSDNKLYITTDNQIYYTKR